MRFQLLPQNERLEEAARQETVARPGRLRMQVGYLGDLSYFMLAEAARGLGLREAANTYYKRALDAGKEYGCGGDAKGSTSRSSPPRRSAADGVYARRVPETS